MIKYTKDNKKNMVNRIDKSKLSSKINIDNKEMKIFFGNAMSYLITQRNQDIILEENNLNRGK